MSEMKQTALNELNEVLAEGFTTIKEAEAHLSMRFEELYSHSEEAQVAFDELDSETDGLLGKYFVYTLSADGETWHIGTGDAFDEAKLPSYIETFSEHYGETFQSVDDLTDKLDHRVMKDMSNAGCDAFTALSMILEEDLGLEGVFVVLGADSEPRIEWANFDNF